VQDADGARYIDETASSAYLFITPFHCPPAEQQHAATHICEPPLFS